MIKRFIDKVAIVTGGTSGIGAAIVERLAREGAITAHTGQPNVPAPRRQSAHEQS